MYLQKYILQLADTALIHSQRLAEWCGHAPALEVDIAVSNIALDHIGAARSFYQYVAILLDNHSTEDSIAFLRKDREYLNLLMTELPNGNFAKTIAKCFYLDHFLFIYYTALGNSKNEQLSAIAKKSIKEVTYHLRFSSEWVVRLGDGTPESKQKMQEAIDEIWPYTGEFFTPSEAELEAIKNGEAPDTIPMQEVWLQQIQKNLLEASLLLPTTNFKHIGGKNGFHTEHFNTIIMELQYMQRTYPNANW
jgi:ring-1,2-phenylacetyl-CoA epoxidase subunit PaaC